MSDNKGFPHTLELKLPKMGESITEATITDWLVSEGDEVEQDQTILEVATHKVDSEVPVPQTGIMNSFKLFIIG